MSARRLPRSFATTAASAANRSGLAYGASSRYSASGGTQRSAAVSP